MTRWPSAPLGEVCDIVGGGTPSRTQPKYFGGKIPWATPTDVTALRGRVLTRTRECITEAGLKNSSARLVPAGTVLLTSRATIGFTAIAEVPVATNQGFANFICGSKLDAGFLAFWLETQREQLTRLAGGTTFKEITKGTLKKLLVPLPPLVEQRRIVDILDRAASIRSLRRQAQETARQIVPALFNKMFGDPDENPMGWPVRLLGTVLHESPRNGLSPSRAGIHSDNVLTLSAITRGSFDVTTVKGAKFARPVAQRERVSSLDFLVTRGNGNLNLVGRGEFPTRDMPQIAFPDTIIAVRPNQQELSPECSPLLGSKGPDNEWNFQVEPNRDCQHAGYAPAARCTTGFCGACIIDHAVGPASGASGYVFSGRNRSHRSAPFRLTANGAIPSSQTRVNER
jgi:type I restriction enzyme, S subunit